MNHRTFRTVVLLLSVLQPLMALSPVLAGLAADFPGVPQTLVQQLLSVPQMVAVPTMLVCGLLARRIASRPLVLAGIAVMVAALVAPAFLTSFGWIFATRVLAGIGYGMITPFTLSLIADHFEGAERNTLYGLQGTALNLGGVLFSLIGGLVGILGWRTNAFVALLGIPFFLMALLGLPRLPVVRREKETASHFTPAAWRIYLVIVLSQAFIWVFPPSVAFVLADRGFPGSAVAGTAMMVFTAGGFSGGILFTPLHRVVGRHVTAFGFLCGTAGLAVVALAPASYAAFLVGAFLLGLCGSFSVSCLMVDLTAAVPGASMTATMSVALSFLVGGTALGPVLSGVVRSVVPGLAVEAVFLGSAGLLALMAAAQTLMTRPRSA